MSNIYSFTNQPVAFSAYISSTVSSGNNVSITNSNTSSDTPISILQSSLNTSNSTQLILGRANSAFNSAYINFNYLSLGSSTNKLTLGINGQSGLTIDGLNNLIVPGSITSSISSGTNLTITNSASSGQIPLTIFQSALAVGQISQIQLGISNTTNLSGSLQFTNVSSGTPELNTVSLGLTGTSNKLTINGTGLVTINNSGPTNTNRTLLVLNTTESNSLTGASIDFSQGGVVVGRINSKTESNGNIGLYFSTYSAGSVTERMSISATGNVNVFGATRITGTNISSYTRTFDTSPNQTGTMVQYSATTGTANFEIDVITSGGFQTFSAKYKISNGYNSTNGGWQRCIPFNFFNANADSYELQINTNNQTTIFRLVHSNADVASTVTMNMITSYPQNDLGSFTDLTASALTTDANWATYSFLSTTVLIQTLGNVGIGTTTPNAQLQLSNSVVNRKLVLFDNVNNDHQYYGFGVNSGKLRYQIDATSAAHSFYAATSSTTSNEIFTIAGTGNVGIGITPNAQLHLSTSTANRKIVLFEGTNNDHQFYGFGVNSATLRYQVLSTADAHVFFAGVNSGASSELMRISGNGAVNISGLTASSAVATDASKNLISVTNTGTGNNVLATSPTINTSLTISGSLTTTGTANIGGSVFIGTNSYTSDSITITNTGINALNNLVIPIHLFGRNLIVGNNAQYFYNYISDNNSSNGFSIQLPAKGVALSILNSGISTTSMSITGSLNVTGSTNIGGNLEVTNASPIITVGTSGGAGGSLYFGNSAHGILRDGSNNVVVYTTSGSVSLRANGLGGGDEITCTSTSVTINNDTTINGNTAITATTNTRLIINTSSGGVNMTIRTDGSAVVGSITNNGANTSFNTSSDYRLKKNIKPIKNIIDTLRQLKPYNFDFISNGFNTDGFIAHEVQEILPYCVHGEKDGEQMQSIDYSKLTPLLVAAVQQQQIQIDLLTNFIKNKFPEF